MEDSNIPGVHSKAAERLANENKRLKVRIGGLTCELSDKTAEYGHIMMLRQSKIENLENLVGVYEKRLARMAGRLTNLAAERNHLLLEVQRYKESWERFNEGLDQVGRGDDD